MVASWTHLCNELGWECNTFNPIFVSRFLTSYERISVLQRQQFFANTYNCFSLGHKSICFFNPARPKLWDSYSIQMQSEGRNTHLNKLAFLPICAYSVASSHMCFFLSCRTAESNKKRLAYTKASSFPTIFLGTVANRLIKCLTSAATGAAGFGPQYLHP